MPYDLDGWKNKMRELYNQRRELMRDHGPHEYRTTPPEKPQQFRTEKPPHYDVRPIEYRPRIERIAERMAPDLYKKSIEQTKERDASDIERRRKEEREPI